MADDYTTDPGSGGATFHAKDDGTRLWPIGLTAYDFTTPTTVDLTHGLPVQPQTASTWAVTGTFWQATQPVSIASSVTITGTINAAQSGTWNITNISGTVSLPTGAATAAKQPALGTAGTASADVITIQGIASMTAVKVDGSGVTQPVSGTVTANAGTGTFTISGAVTQSGTWNIGTVTTVTGVTTVSTVTAVTTVSTVTNLSQMSGAAIAMGTGTRSAGTQRVTIATDDIVPASQSGTWTVGISAAQTLATVTTVGTLTTLTGGGVASDGVDSGNPVKTGARAVATLSTATLVAAADRVDSVADLDGASLTRQNAALGDLVNGLAAITDGSSTSVIASAGAGVKNYITDVIIANSSASNVTVDLRDGAAGAVKATFPVPATGGVVLSLKSPIGFSAATAVCADPSASATTITVTLSGFKSKI